MIVLATAHSLQTLLGEMYAIITLESDSFGVVLIPLFSQPIVYKQDVVYLPIAYVPVFLFTPVYRRGHPKNYLFYFMKKIFLDLNIPKMTSFNFEK